MVDTGGKQQCKMSHQSYAIIVFKRISTITSKTRPVTALSAHKIYTQQSHGGVSFFTNPSRTTEIVKTCRGAVKRCRKSDQDATGDEMTDLIHITIQAFMTMGMGDDNS